MWDGLAEGRKTIASVRSFVSLGRMTPHEFVMQAQKQRKGAIGAVTLW